MRALSQCVLWTLGYALGLLLRLLAFTWRVRIEGEGPARAALCLFWHGQMVTLCALGRWLGHIRPTVLISQSRDGALAAGAARALGLRVVRGSSSSGGPGAGLSMVRRLRGGEVGAIAVDGPRGPCGQVTGDPLRLARLGRSEMFAVAAKASEAYTLGSWDALRVPRPFARVHVVWQQIGRSCSVAEVLRASECTAARLLSQIEGCCDTGAVVQAALDESAEASRSSGSAAPKSARVARRAGHLCGFLLTGVLAFGGVSCDRERRAALEALQGRSAPERIRALRILGARKDPALATEIAAALRDPSARVRHAALLALGQAGIASVRGAVVARFADPEPEIRVVALKVAGASGERRFSGAIVALLEDPASPVRQAAGEALSALGMSLRDQRRASASGQLERLLRDLRLRDDERRVAAIEALGRSGREAAAEPLIALNAWGSPTVEVARAEALARLGDRRGVIFLRSLAKREDGVSRLAVVRALAFLGASHAAVGWRLAQRLLADSDMEIREKAARSIARLASPIPADIVSVLCSALAISSDEGRAFRISAAEALRSHRQLAKCTGALGAISAEAGNWLSAGRSAPFAQVGRMRELAALLTGWEPQLALRVLRRLAELAVEEELSWVSAERWSELELPVDRGLPPSALLPTNPAAKRPSGKDRVAALSALLARFPRIRHQTVSASAQLMPPRIQMAQVVELIRALEASEAAAQWLSTVVDEPNISLAAAGFERLAAWGPQGLSAALTLKIGAAVRTAVDKALTSATWLPAGGPTAARGSGGPRIGAESSRVTLIRDAAVAACAFLGRSEAQAMGTSLIASRRVETRARAAECLGRLKAATAVPTLLSELERAPQLGLIEALGQIGDRRAARPLAQLLARGATGQATMGEGERLLVIEALARLGGTEAAKALYQELFGRSWRVRKAAARALRGSTLPGLRDALAGCCEDFYREVRLACAGALRSMPPS